MSDIEVHPQFPCFVEGKKICTYIADFKYKNVKGEEVIEDTKGVLTDVFKLKKKLVEAIYPDVTIEVIQSPSGLMTQKTRTCTLCKKRRKIKFF